MRQIFFAAMIFLLFVLVGCNRQISKNPEICSADSDCVCNGIDKASGNCFVGNKEYYESGAVDKSQHCPDFCTGIAGHIVTKCVEGKCMNVNKNTFPECSFDSDCVPSDCFHASSCIPKSSAPKCDGVFGTADCRQGTLDCGGYCSCESKRCVAKNLYSPESEIPVV